MLTLNKKRLLYLFFGVIYSLLLSIFLGPAKAENNQEVIQSAIYKNPEYIQEHKNKANCEINGAWTKEFKYFWLADIEDNKKNFPPFVKNLTYRGVIEKANNSGISTLEALNLDSSRNGYFLTSSLPGEKIGIEFDLEHNLPYVEWIPLNLYFDPFVLEDLDQQIQIKLSYANSSLGRIVYLQNINFNVGCYLNLLIKSPPKGEIGKVVIEIKPKDNNKAAISGVFWKEEHEHSNLKLEYAGSNEVSAPTFFENERVAKKSIIWSPTTDKNLLVNDIVKISLGTVTYTTSNGFEFPLDLKNKTYNYQILKGVSGQPGFSGLEFYIEPLTQSCRDGCDFSLYFTENYKQKIYIYSAYEDRKNKLLKELTPEGKGAPTFENFHIEPNENVKLRIRITSDDKSVEPVLRGISILPNEVEIFEVKENENVFSDEVKTEGDFHDEISGESSSSKNTHIEHANPNTTTMTIYTNPVRNENPRPAWNDSTRPTHNTTITHPPPTNIQASGPNPINMNSGSTGNSGSSSSTNDSSDDDMETVIEIDDHDNDNESSTLTQPVPIPTPLPFISSPLTDSNHSGLKGSSSSPIVMIPTPGSIPSVPPMPITNSSNNGPNGNNGNGGGRIENTKINNIPSTTPNLIPTDNKINEGKSSTSNGENKSFSPPSN